MDASLNRRHHELVQRMILPNDVLHHTPLEVQWIWKVNSVAIVTLQKAMDTSLSRIQNKRINHYYSTSSMY